MIRIHFIGKDDLEHPLNYEDYEVYEAMDMIRELLHAHSLVDWTCDDAYLYQEMCERL